MWLYYIMVALTAFLYALSALAVLFAVATAVGCIVSETGRRIAGGGPRRHNRRKKHHRDEDSAQ